MVADFSGWATKAGLKCTDGRTIMPGAFKHQDGLQVPLVWQHGHSDVENVLGHAILTHKEGSVWTEGFFNETPKAVHAKELLQHGDIKMLSIWANQLVERASMVLHGAIREVSLVLSGANPGALIENVTIRHSDGEELALEDEAIIYTGLELEHADGDDEDKTDGGDEDKRTVQEIYESMDEAQKGVLHYMLGQVAEATSEEGSSAEQSNLTDGTEDPNTKGTQMTNVFEKEGEDKGAGSAHVLSHSDLKGIIADATKGGSLKAAVESYALAHGITDIEVLFPEATQLTAAPEFYTRRMEWVNGVLSGARKTPFSRIKTATADLTFDEARAKGYVKGDLKKEEFYGTSRRITTPQTIYKKQKLDRDDIIDITDFDVVAWMKGEMRVMLDEELARAVLIGDGRDVADEDKIQETFIRPIAKDDEFYTVRVNVNLGDASSSAAEIVDAVISARQHYRGSGQPTFYTTETIIASFLLLKDTLGRRIYSSLDQVAAEMRVSSLVPVEVLESEPDIVGIIVNMSDYVIGADKGGQVAMFDDFDIDYNQYKYLIETRCSGALVRPKSAMVVTKMASALLLATPTSPTFVPATGVITIPTVTGVVYKDGATTLTAGAQAALASGASKTITAVPAGTHYFASSEDDTWTFTRTT